MAKDMQTKSGRQSIKRREFLIGSGAALAAGAVGIYAPETEASSLTQKVSSAARQAYPASTGYLVYDSRLCITCQSCMFACSMTHEGEANPSLSRIQIIKDAPSFTKYPYDVVIAVCRQCVTPLCVQNCPTGACHVSEANGNIRMIDETRCVGCKLCISSCPQRPHRTVWNPVKRKSTKCDLCVNAPYWSEKGGPQGRQACVEICPAKALKLVKETPPQSDIAGYDVDLAPPAQAPKIPVPKS